MPRRGRQARGDPPQESLATLRPRPEPPPRSPRRPTHVRVADGIAKLLMAVGFAWALIVGWGNLPLPVSIVFLLASVAVVTFSAREIVARRRARRPPRR